MNAEAAESCRDIEDLLSAYQQKIRSHRHHRKLALILLSSVDVVERATSKSIRVVVLLAVASVIPIHGLPRVADEPDSGIAFEQVAQKSYRLANPAFRSAPEDPFMSLSYLKGSFEGKDVWQAPAIQAIDAQLKRPSRKRASRTPKATPPSPQQAERSAPVNFLQLLFSKLLNRG